MRGRRIAWRVLVGVLIFLDLPGAAGVGGYLWLRASQPRESGVLKVAGLTGPVEIDRDAAGAPHIRARTTDDAFFALGFAEAQDRLFQMDLLRHYGEGRISEIAGGFGLKLDRFMRILGFETVAERQ
ncbi:MAG: penicillin acylase family protein, partial [Caulobacteraceae bacterium]